MIFSKEVLFVHVPKTGGMSLTNLLLKVLSRPTYYSHPDGHALTEDEGIIHLAGFRHETLDEAAKIVREYGYDLEDFPLILSVLRNPYALEVSRYAYLRKGHPWDGGHNQQLALRGDFERFAIHSFPHGGHERPLESYFLIDGQRPANLAILRCEELGLGVREALAKVGIKADADLPHENESEHDNFLEYYTPAAEAAVYSRYRWAFDQGFYDRIDFDSPSEGVVHSAADLISPDPSEPDRWTPQWPAGHYYSPIPSLADVRQRESSIFTVPSTIAGVDLRENEQLDLVQALQGYHLDQPFQSKPTCGMRYHYENGFFGYGDGIVLYSMLRHVRPRRVVEVGSGFSSALILDVNEQFLGGAVECTFIDPYPDRLRTLLRPSERDRIEVLPVKVQEVDLDVFTDLQVGDILFIDSSHVSKVGSEVNWLFFEVLPRLSAGVLVHIHDVMYPFEYPKSWVYEGRAWNEAYLLRAFLSFNHAYRIRLFNAYLACFHRERVATAMPLWAKNTGGSIWLERT